jgi:hypothetical protein
MHKTWILDANAIKMTTVRKILAVAAVMAAAEGFTSQSAIP